MTKRERNYTHKQRITRKVRNWLYRDRWNWEWIQKDDNSMRTSRPVMPPVFLDYVECLQTYRKRGGRIGYMMKIKPPK